MTVVIMSLTDNQGMKVIKEARAMRAGLATRFQLFNQLIEREGKLDSQHLDAITERAGVMRRISALTQQGPAALLHSEAELVLLARQRDELAVVIEQCAGERAAIEKRIRGEYQQISFECVDRQTIDGSAIRL